MSPDILLTIWLSPSFPVGAFAYSHGLEWAAEAGDVRDEATLVAWLKDLVEHGGARADAILLASTMRATFARNADALREINELALALAPSAERRLETAQQGRSFHAAIAAAWSKPGVDWANDILADEIAYPVAGGIACAAHDIPPPRACEAFALGFVANLVSAAVRLSLIGQTQGQRVLAALAANLSIAIAKFFAFTVTGSSSMLAESIHSVADSGNQGLLLLGARRSRKAANLEHPFGYGRERYFWGFVVALVLFSLGSLFAIYEGLHKLEHPEPIERPEWALGVLAFASILFRRPPQ